MYFIYGAYGAGNLGDDILLKSALELHADKKCKVIAYGPPALDPEIPYINHFDFINNPESFINEGDTLTFAGGGLFWAASHAEDMLKCARVAKQKRAKVLIERIGAQGVHAASDIAREFFEIAESASVRDNESVKLLKELNITDRAIYEPDFALILKDIPKKKNRTSDKLRVGINHSATPFFHDPQHRNKTLAIYSSLSKRLEDKFEFYYIPHTRHFNVMAQNDVVYGEYFWQASGGRIQALPFADVNTLLSHYSSMDLLLGWRYHLLVLATRYETPAIFVGSNGGHKYGAFMREHNLNHVDFDVDKGTVLKLLLNSIASTMNV